MNNGLFGWPIGKSPAAFGFPLGGPLPKVQNLVQSSGTETTVTAPGSLNAKGAWTTIIAAADFQASMIGWNAQIDQSNVPQILMDIGIGAAGSERVLIPNLLITGSSGSEQFSTIKGLIPMYIPSGERVSARFQRSQAKALALSLYLCGQKFENGALPRSVESLGHDLSDSGGLVIDPGGSANTKGSWTTVGYNTKNWCGVMTALGARANTVMTTATFYLDIAIGEAGAEQIILPDFHVNANATGDALNYSISEMWPCVVPAGTRISARMSSATTDATDRLLDVVVYGLSYSDI